MDVRPETTVQISVLIDAPDDPLTSAGARESLRHFDDVSISRNGPLADLVMVLTDRVDSDALARIRAAHAVNCRPVVLVASVIDAHGVLAAAEAGARGILHRHDAQPARLVELVRSAARGEGSIPVDVLGEVLDQVGHLQGHALAPLGYRLSGLTERETQVLRLVAEGLETAEIAEQLHFSQRTIKGVLHDVTMRLNLRNRAHAVAYAMRQGLI